MNRTYVRVLILSIWAPRGGQGARDAHLVGHSTDGTVAPSSIVAMTLVTVRYFAAAAEAAGVDEERLELTDGATLGALRDELVARYGAPMQRVLRSGSFLIDGTVRREAGHPVAERVDILPPFAGG